MNICIECMGDFLRGLIRSSLVAGNNLTCELKYDLKGIQNARKQRLTKILILIIP